MPNKTYKPEPWWEEGVFLAFIVWTVGGIILQGWGVSKTIFRPNFELSHYLSLLFRADRVTLILNAIIIIYLVAYLSVSLPKWLDFFDDPTFGGLSMLIILLTNLSGYFQLSLYLRESGGGAWVYGLFVLAVLWVAVCCGGFLAAAGLERQRRKY